MYHLLPFRFERINNHEIIVNEVGDYLIVPLHTVHKIVHKQIAKDEDLYKNLIASFFISESPVPELIDVLSVRLRTKKAFLDQFTSLHIFVLTLRCNQNCVYCQASSKGRYLDKFDMDKKDLYASIVLMFKSPTRHITMEFQGGESSLVPELLEFAIESSILLNIDYQKKITYVLCTNVINLTERVLNLCAQYNVLISTSLDGPQFIHNKNRGSADSYQKVIQGIDLARERLGFDRVSALMTTSEFSLDYPKEIVDNYIENGFNSIFLRPLNPYGEAVGNTSWNTYFDRYVEFYKEALDYIIELNQNGKVFVEEFSAILLRKILTPFSTGFVDLQSPAGLINSVVVYNYDGFVYASDESRMLAEFGDLSFRLGHSGDPYESLFYGRRTHELSKIWATEIIAGCSDCGFQSYCGADPVRNHSTQNDEYGCRPTSSFCRKHRAIIRHLFTLLIERETEVLPIFQQWISNNGN